MKEKAPPSKKYIGTSMKEKAPPPKSIWDLDEREDPYPLKRSLSKVLHVFFCLDPVSHVAEIKAIFSLVHEYGHGFPLFN